MNRLASSGTGRGKGEERSAVQIRVIRGRAVSLQRGRGGDGVGTGWGRSGDGVGTEWGRSRRAESPLRHRMLRPEPECSLPRSPINSRPGADGRPPPERPGSAFGQGELRAADHAKRGGLLPAPVACRRARTEQRLNGNRSTDRHRHHIGAGARMTAAETPGSPRLSGAREPGRHAERSGASHHASHASQLFNLVASTGAASTAREESSALADPPGSAISRSRRRIAQPATRDPLLVAQRLHRVHPRGAQRRQVAGADRHHRRAAPRRARSPPGRCPCRPKSSELRGAAQAERRGDPDHAADHQHHPPTWPQHHARSTSRRRRRAPCARRSRGCAAPPCRPARRTSPTAASSVASAAKAAESVLIIRSRKMFSRTCCGSVFRSSTGRFGSSRAITRGNRAAAAAPGRPRCARRR